MIDRPPASWSPGGADARGGKRSKSTLAVTAPNGRTHPRPPRTRSDAGRRGLHRYARASQRRSKRSRRARCLDGDDSRWPRWIPISPRGNRRARTFAELRAQRRSWSSTPQEQRPDQVGSQVPRRRRRWGAPFPRPGGVGTPATSSRRHRRDPGPRHRARRMVGDDPAGDEAGAIVFSPDGKTGLLRSAKPKPRVIPGAASSIDPQAGQDWDARSRSDTTLGGIGAGSPDAQYEDLLRLQIIRITDKKLSGCSIRHRHLAPVTGNSQSQLGRTPEP